MKLHRIAHSRAGDKGNISDLSVITYDPRHFPALRELLTVEVVGAHFDDVVQGRVERFELPQLHALKFVLHEALGEGVTRTLNLDGHGKSLSSSLLDLELPDEPFTPRISVVSVASA